MKAHQNSPPQQQQPFTLHLGRSLRPLFSKLASAFSSSRHALFHWNSSASMDCTGSCRQLFEQDVTSVLPLGDGQRKLQMHMQRKLHMQ